MPWAETKEAAHRLVTPFDPASAQLRCVSHLLPVPSRPGLTVIFAEITLDKQDRVHARGFHFEVCLCRGPGLFCFLKLIAQKHLLTRNLAILRGHWPGCPKVTCLQKR